MTDITFASSTMLLSLNISIWSGNKLDKGETADVRSRTGARQGAVRVHKSLLPDAKELLDLKRHATARPRVLQRPHRTVGRRHADHALRRLP